MTLTVLTRARGDTPACTCSSSGRHVRRNQAEAYSCSVSGFRFAILVLTAATDSSVRARFCTCTVREERDCAEAAHTQHTSTHLHLLGCCVATVELCDDGRNAVLRGLVLERLERAW